MRRIGCSNSTEYSPDGNRLPGRKQGDGRYSGGIQVLGEEGIEGNNNLTLSKWITRIAVTKKLGRVGLVAKWSRSWGGGKRNDLAVSNCNQQGLSSKLQGKPTGGY